MNVIMFFTRRYCIRFTLAGRVLAVRLDSAMEWCQLLDSAITILHTQNFKMEVLGRKRFLTKFFMTQRFF